MADPTIWQMVEDKHLIGLVDEQFEVLIQDVEASGMKPDAFDMAGVQSNFKFNQVRKIYNSYLTNVDSF